MKRMLRYIYSRPLSIMILVTMISIWAWAMINKFMLRDEHGNRIMKYLNIVVLWGEIIVVLYVTLFSRTAGEREVCLIPLYSFVLADEQPELYRSMFMNVLLFVPLGLTMPYVLRLKKICKREVWITFLGALFFSIMIELAQYLFHLGRVEVDDVVFNILGAIIGCASFFVFDWIEKGKYGKKIFKN